MGGYKAFCWKAIKGEGNGRLKGGLGILLSTSLCGKSRPLHYLKNWAMAICVQVREAHLILVNVSIPPYSTNSVTSSIWAKLENYLEELYTKNKADLVIIGGDFNARTGHNDQVTSIKYIKPTMPLEDDLPHTINGIQKMPKSTLQADVYSEWLQNLLSIF